MGYRNFFHFILSLTLICLIFWLIPFAYDIFVKFAVALLAIRLAEYLMTNTRKYFLHTKVSSKNKAILITGCDSGFGNMLAKRMDGLGYRVFAGCLFPDGEGAKDLANNSSSNLTIFPLDVTSDKSVDSAKDLVTNNLGVDVLWAVVNNAGIGQGGEIDWTHLSEFQKVVEVNTFGVIRVTKAFLPLLRKSEGRVVNITSLLGKVCIPGLVGYCMSKSAAISFTTGLRMEMTKWKVKAISIEPFFYTTPLTKTKPAVDLLEKMWDKIPNEIREEYGEAYKEVIKKACVNLLARSSPKIYEVLDCFEDAITAKEPLTTYSPGYLPDTLGLQLLRALPSTVIERYLLTYLDRKVKPAALMKKEAKTTSVKEK